MVGRKELESKSGNVEERRFSLELVEQAFRPAQRARKTPGLQPLTDRHFMVSPQRDCLMGRVVMVPIAPLTIPER